MIEKVAEVKLEAPGCFGRPSVFSHKNVVCKACPVKSACVNAVEAKLRAFATVENVSDHLIRLRNGKTADENAGNFRVEPASIDIGDDMPARKQRIARVKRALTPSEERMVEALPVKVKVEAVKLITAGFADDMHKVLLSGKNPFPYEGKRYLHVACETLLNRGFTKLSLREEYQKLKKHNGEFWTKETAFSHVSIVLALFKAFDLIVEEKGVFTLNKMLKEGN